MMYKSFQLRKWWAERGVTLSIQQYYVCSRSMLVIKSRRTLLWALAALILPNISYPEAGFVQIDSTKLRSIEISYSINTGGVNFCYLSFFTESESVVRSPAVSYGIITDNRLDEVSPLAEYTQYSLPSEREKLFMFSLASNTKITGDLVLYDEGSIPSEAEFTMQLVVRGFECDAISPAERERGFSFDEIDTQTSAPRNVAEDKLLAIFSEEFLIDLNGL